MGSTFYRVLDVEKMYIVQFVKKEIENGTLRLPLPSYCLKVAHRVLRDSAIIKEKRKRNI